MRYIKLKDMPKNWVIDGRHFKGNKRMKIKSGWNRGFWLQRDGSSRIEPMFFNSFADIENKMISLHKHEEGFLECKKREAVVNPTTTDVKSTTEGI